MENLVILNFSGGTVNYYTISEEEAAAAVEKLHNQQLYFDIEKITTYDNPIVNSNTHPDSDTGEMQYIIEIADNTYFYESAQERNEDIKTIRSILAGAAQNNEGTDLFEDYKNMPEDVKIIIEKYGEKLSNGDYRDLEAALKEVQEIGYTFEYYLDGTAYDLRRIGDKGKLTEADIMPTPPPAFNPVC